MSGDNAQNEFIQNSTEQVKEGIIKNNKLEMIKADTFDIEIDNLIKEVNEIKGLAYAMCAKHSSVVSDYAAIGNKAELIFRRLQQIKQK